MDRARDLPVMNSASQLTDAFAEVRFGTVTARSEICRKTLHPEWGYRTNFEVRRPRPASARTAPPRVPR